MAVRVSLDVPLAHDAGWRIVYVASDMGTPQSEDLVVGFPPRQGRVGRVTWLIAAGFCGAALIAVHANTFLNNEGIYTWIFSGLTTESPLELLFFLNARPPIALFYAPVVVLGLKAFLVTHVIVATLAIPLTADLARHFNQERPNFAALLVAVSPLYFAATAAGVQNTDGTVGLLLVVWLLARARPIAAGVLLSLMMIARVEVAFFGLALAAYSLRSPSLRRFVPAAAVIPVLYLLAGAVYHGDLLWPVHYPSFPWTNETISSALRAHYGGDLKGLIATVLALTPVIGTTLWLSFRDVSRLEALLSVTAIGFVLAIRVVPFTQLIYVDASPRYVLPALPFLCLAINRAASQWGQRWSRDLVRAAALLGAAALVAVPTLDAAPSRDALWLDDSVGVLLLAICAACAAAAAIAFFSKRAAVATLLTVAAVAGPPFLPSTHLYFGHQARQLEDCARWIEAAHVPPGTVVVTDMHLLRIWIDAYAPQLDVDVRHVVTPDMVYQTKVLTNPATRQFEALSSSKRFFYAPMIFIEDVAALPDPVLVVMRTDIHRSDFLSQPPFDKVEWLVKQRDWLGGRLVREPMDRATATP